VHVAQVFNSTNALTAEQIATLTAINPQLLLAFWSSEPLAAPTFLTAAKAALPNVAMVGCSTAGDITAEGVHDAGYVLTAIRFDHSRFHVAEVDSRGLADSMAAGRRLGAAIPQADLRAVLLLAHGVDINGSALIDGLAAELPADVVISGGLAGDNGAFTGTCVLGANGLGSHKLVAIGFYGERLQIGVGCRGGWKAFGPTRKISRAEGSRLFELDGLPALDLYKKYLGDYARDLPAAGLLFPFEMLDDEKKSIGLLRTIIGIDEADQSLVLAGSVDEGAYVRLMHSSTDALVDGAEQAAEDCVEISKVANLANANGLAILVSCVGRKLVMGDRVDEEVTAVAGQLGSGFTLAGFYSNGEVSPLKDVLDCKLHNQTMTITLLSEH
jgi:hypothetical protein